MKTYFLEDIAAREDVAAALTRALPGQQQTWLLQDLRGDVIAYFNIEPERLNRERVTVAADLSGRHYDEDKSVVQVLIRIQKEIGGNVRGDDDRTI
jgi:hypothetical protein